MKTHLSPPSGLLFLVDVKNQGRAGSAGEREHSTAEADWGCEIQVSPALNSWVPARQRSSTKLWKGFSNTAREHRFFPPHAGKPAAHTALQTGLRCCASASLCLAVAFFMACARTDPEYQKPSVHLILDSCHPEADSHCYAYFVHLDGFLVALTLCSFTEDHFLM